MILIDTSILMAAVADTGDVGDRVRTSLAKVDRERGRLSPQIVREFYGAATRPSIGDGLRPGLGLTPRRAEVVLDAFVEAFPIVSEDTKVIRELRRIASKYAVLGKQIHDANVVATAVRHGLRSVLTLNTRDFRRFAGEIDVVSPENV